jgi:hypothetical protein
MSNQGEYEKYQSNHNDTTMEGTMLMGRSKLLSTDRTYNQISENY